ncbi:unnamed protein product [Acanthoscelides obtectus]|uniref:Uncharacterized protein n=1 Tax=Acanthoscelides obtectus TaxID=200917 RepID=A0A9P0M4R4_ACAOB|nr:unnamed protein product [Acanthoscelides obtectus]CAK1684866.1 hypothetical protein AOBTE_LOCUS35151 [Acanthoscelides obtectus]
MSSNASIEFARDGRFELFYIFSLKTYRITDYRDINKKFGYTVVKRLVPRASSWIF